MPLFFSYSPSLPHICATDSEVSKFGSLPTNQHTRDESSRGDPPEFFKFTDNIDYLFGWRS